MDKADAVLHRGMEPLPTNSPTVSVASWSAIIVDRAGETPRRFGVEADESQIPAATRRRLGPYARLAVSCGLAVTTPDSDIIFCSRYGDVTLASRLLSDLIDASPMSPAAFSLSVHNAVPGVMDLVRSSRVGHTAIAAGPDSLSAGFCEAWAKLSAAPETAITLLYADYALPTIYDEFATYDVEGLAFAVSLKAFPDETSSATLQLGSCDMTASAMQDPASDVLVQALVNVLQSEEPSELGWKSKSLNWALRVAAHA